MGASVVALMRASPVRARAALGAGVRSRCSGRAPRPPPSCRGACPRPPPAGASGAECTHKPAPAAEAARLLGGDRRRGGATGIGRDGGLTKASPAAVAVGLLLALLLAPPALPAFAAAALLLPPLLLLRRSLLRSRPRSRRRSRLGLRLGPARTAARAPSALACWHSGPAWPAECGKAELSSPAQKAVLLLAWRSSIALNSPHG